MRCCAGEEELERRGGLYEELRAVELWIVFVVAVGFRIIGWCLDMGANLLDSLQSKHGKQATKRFSHYVLDTNAPIHEVYALTWFPMLKGFAHPYIHLQPNTSM